MEIDIELGISHNRLGPTGTGAVADREQLCLVYKEFKQEFREVQVAC